MLTIENVYITQLNYQHIQLLYVIDLGMSINEGGLYLVDDNDGLKKILSKLNSDTYVVEFFC